MNRLTKGEWITLAAGIIIVVAIIVALIGAPHAASTITKETMTKAAQNGDHVYVNYIGTLQNGTKFDSSYDRGQPIDFTLGAGQVIKGWDEGIVGMKVGEKKHLIIPPEKAYGAQAVGPIPPNSTLVFDIELVDIK